MIFNNGDKFNENFIVTDNIYNGFINLFKDRNPLHTNTEFAVLKGFESKVMHGNILNGFISFFIGECLPTKNVIIHSQEIQFKNAVFLNDKLDFQAEVTGIFNAVNVVEFKFTFKNKKNKTVSKGKIQIGLLE